VFNNNYNKAEETQRYFISTYFAWLKFPAGATFIVAIYAAFLVTVSFFLQHNLYLNLSDEGFWWYGTLRTAEGEVPILDFQSYDPGRYYWSAFWVRLFGDGLITLRASGALFQFIGLFLGLLVARRILTRWWYTGIFGLVLLLSMYPRYAHFDQTLAITAVYFGLLLLERPSLQRHFVTGVFVGLAAWFGRNHGLYGLIAFSLLIVFIRLQDGQSNLLYRIFIWSLGIVVGYSPMLIMMVVIPGYFEAFIESLLTLIRIGSTNISIPIIWPWDFWNEHHPQVGTVVTLRLFFKGLINGQDSSIGLILSLWVVAIVTAILATISKKVRLNSESTPFFAAAAIAIPYLHYAMSRADNDHLGRSIAPLLLLVSALPVLVRHTLARRLITISSALLLALLSFYFISSSYFYRWIRADPEDIVVSTVKGADIVLNRRIAQLIKTVENIDKEYVQQDEGIFIGPHLTTLYVVLDRRSPTREIYLLFKETEKRQKEMISELEENLVNWAILGNRGIDGRNDLKLMNTYPVVWNYFQENFDNVSVEALPSEYVLLRRRSLSVKQ
jgi:hypothetical protein